MSRQVSPSGQVSQTQASEQTQQQHRTPTRYSGTRDPRLSRFQNQSQFPNSQSQSQLTPTQRVTQQHATQDTTMAQHGSMSPQHSQLGSSMSPMSQQQIYGNRETMTMHSMPMGQIRRMSIGHPSHPIHSGGISYTQGVSGTAVQGCEVC